MSQDEYLQHYGILGMKWGVRRFQNKDGTLTAKGKKRYDSDPSNDDESSKTSEKKRFQLTEKQKTWIKRGAIAAGVLLAAYGLYKLNQVDPAKQAEIDKMIKEAEYKISNKRDWKRLDFDEALGLVKKEKGHTWSPEDDLRAINEGMHLWKKGAQNNCTFCTTAYELRRRGYDVKANFTEQGRTTSHIKDFFKNTVVETDDSVMWALDSMKFPPGTSTIDRRSAKRSRYIDLISKKLAEYGEGARGNLLGSYSMGGGHSIIWEVKNGKTIFRDGQGGFTYRDAKDALQYFVPGKTEFFRTDDLEINKDLIREAVSNIGQGRKEMNVMEYDVELANLYRHEVLKYMRANNVSMQTARERIRNLDGVKV